MRWTSITLSAALALSSTAYGSYGSNVMLGGAVGGIFQRHEPGQGQQGAASVLEGRQAAAGRCGTDGGNAKCPAGQCCSQWGYCGVGAEFCNPIALCQSDFGSCLGQSQSATAPPPPTTTAAPPPPPVTTTTRAPPPPPPTTTSAVPPPPTTTSAPRPPPSTSANPPPPVSTSPVPPGTLVPSTNGMCGNSTTCAGSGRGSCCSQFFYCGDGIEFCGTGCQSKFGLCFGGFSAPGPASSGTSKPAVPTTTSAAAPPPTSAPKPSTTTSAAAPPPATSSPAAALPPGVSVTTDGSCGNGKTCLGSTFGQCCSQFGFCGNGEQFCPAIVACQPEWGHCDA
ncbi:hypothetical protein Sste5346_007211 [Sporothrix stenoceras]|uniref:Chitin-binding type-1 domain-containing protein n=1 Tax=Sporothrix stenoceras TaxID=5173 RepID=A0ABR3YV38_9PEZI